MNNNWDLNNETFPNDPFGNGSSASGNKDEMEFRLWEYIDGISREASVVEKLIADDPAWKTKYAELLDINSLVQETALEEPSLRFTKNVMEEIARLQITPAASKYINTRIIWGIGAFFITAILGFLVYGFSQIEWSADSGSESSAAPFTSIDYGRMFNNTFLNLFMMANVVLGLMLLDRFLAMRRKKFFER